MRIHGTPFPKIPNESRGILMGLRAGEKYATASANRPNKERPRRCDAGFVDWAQQIDRIWGVLDEAVRMSATTSRRIRLISPARGRGGYARHSESPGRYV